MQRSGSIFARILTTLFAALSFVLALLVVSDTAAFAQFQIGVGGGPAIGSDKNQPSHERRQEERTRREHRSGPRLGIELKAGDVRPAYCYTYTFGGVVTCKKRSLDGETCQDQCILSGNGTTIGPAPPARRMAPGVSYRCTCED